MAFTGSWVGGENVHKVKRGSNNRMGGTNDGSRKKKYGDAGMRKRVRFNPNPTSCGHISCMILAESKAAKAAHAFLMSAGLKPVVHFKSGLI